ncbi:hypothetical protein J6590_052170 [Homalodisca vitripennis]|nr:hypothetical protein J6590_052170 [Homalodisca vitripennis]
MDLLCRTDLFYMTIVVDNLHYRDKKIAIRTTITTQDKRIVAGTSWEKRPLKPPEEVLKYDPPLRRKPPEGVFIAGGNINLPYGRWPPRAPDSDKRSTGDVKS